MDATSEEAFAGSGAGDNARDGGPLVSIIVPVYNTEDFLADCIVSVLAQSYPNLDVVLVDDGSTDSSGALCDEYAANDPRVRVVHQANAGLSEARNAGMDHATGHYVMFLDSDDWVASDCVEVLLGLLVDNDAQVALGGTARVLTLTEVARGPAVQGEARVMIGDDFLRDPAPHQPVHPVSAWGKLIERGLLDGVRFPPGRYHEDVFLTHVILHRASRVAITRRVLHYYRQRPGSITAGTMSLKSAADKARAHLSRARDLDAFGLPDVAGLEFRRGVGWHLRVAAAMSRRAPGADDDALVAEMQEQRALLRRPRPGPHGTLRVSVAAYLISPRAISWAYSIALKRAVRRGATTHAIVGERSGV